MVDGEVAAAVGLLVQLGNRVGRVRRAAHLHEAETAALAGGAVAHHVHGCDLAGFLEQSLQIAFGGFVGEISNVQFGAHD